MISPSLAARLRAGGLRWSPQRGDRFMLPGKDMDEDVFIVSDMTIQVHEFPGGRVIGFNGTTEWALDSVQQQEAVWLPSETQLREKLGAAFRRLERDGSAYRVAIEVAGRSSQFEHDDPAQAYGLALLFLITGERVAA
ncbi:MAG TPA: hypothetical protein VHC49_26305 [Mycobacteriales bacterium]|nr:hypothetical protein [Mycobacteriales bacterium]